jgi:hypothetical protein
MNAIKPSTLLRISRPAPFLRTLRLQQQQRSYATDPIPPPPHPPSSPPNPNSPPPPTSKPPSRVAAFYKSFTYPILKCFLGALFTYQLAYYVWFKLEVVEEKALKEGEVGALKSELKEVVVRQKEGVRGVVKTVEEKAEGVKDEVRRKGWWPW